MLAKKDQTFVKKLITATKLAQYPQAYLLELQGVVLDVERGLLTLPTDIVLDPPTPKVRVVSRLMLVPQYHEDKSVKNLAQISCVITAPDAREGKWGIFAAADRPWTLAMARTVVTGSLGDPAVFQDMTDTFTPGAPLKLGPGRADRFVAALHLQVRTTIVVLAHGPDPRSARAHERLLGARAPHYRELLNLAVYHDPRGEWRAYYTSRPIPDVITGKSQKIVLPPVGGMAAIFPPKFPQELIPQDLPLQLSKAQAADTQLVDSWLERLALLGLDPAWANNQLLHDDVYIRYGDQILGNVTTDPAVRLFDQLNTVTADYARLREQLREFEGQRAQFAESEARLREQLEQTRRSEQEARAHVRELRTQVRTQEHDLTRLRALDPERLERERDAALAAQQSTQEQLVGVREELARLRERLAQAEGWPDPEPESWWDLFQLAGNFEYVDVPDSALQPVYGTLDRGQESKIWLERTWATLCQLEDYAKAKAQGASGVEYSNFRLFSEKNATRSVPASRITLAESSSVRQNARMTRARTFSTPIGEVFMEAHIAVGSGKPPAPRLHYYDDTNGDSGRIYVGYVGPHLENTLTN